MTQKTLKKKRVSFQQIRNELEVQANTLLIEQMRLGMVGYRRNKKIQKTIHDKQGWRDYCV
jgi:hypothetical protein